MPDFVLILLRSILAFLFLLILTRIMGSKQLSQLTFFDYVVGITIGSIAATMSVDKNIQISNGLVSLAIWGLFPVALSFIGLKSRKFLQFTDGRPYIVIKDGEVLEDTMKKSKLAIDELMMLLRERGVFKVEDVEIAILETNGQLSVMRKSDLDPVTPQQLGLQIKLEKPPSLVIADGEILQDNLSNLGVTKKWLMNELKKQGIQSIEEVFLGQLDSDKKLYVDVYKDTNGKKKQSK